MALDDCVGGQMDVSAVKSLGNSMTAQDVSLLGRLSGQWWLPRENWDIHKGHHHW